MPFGFPTPVWNPTWDPETVTVQFTLILILIFIRFIVAALTTQWCYCGHALQGVRVSACFNTSSNGGSREVRGEQGGQRWGFFLFSSWISLSLFWHLTPFSLSLLRVPKLPLGSRARNLAPYGTEGPFLCRGNVSTPLKKLHAPTTFVLEVGGKLAGCLDQVTGEKLFKMKRIQAGWLRFLEGVSC